MSFADRKKEREDSKAKNSAIVQAAKDKARDSRPEIRFNEGLGAAANLDKPIEVPSGPDPSHNTKSNELSRPDPSNGTKAYVSKLDPPGLNPDANLPTKPTPDNQQSVDMRKLVNIPPRELIRGGGHFLDLTVRIYHFEMVTPATQSIRVTDPTGHIPAHKHHIDFYSQDGGDGTATISSPTNTGNESNNHVHSFLYLETTVYGETRQETTTGVHTSSPDETSHHTHSIGAISVTLAAHRHGVIGDTDDHAAINVVFDGPGYSDHVVNFPDQAMPVDSNSSYMLCWRNGLFRGCFDSKDDANYPKTGNPDLIEKEIWVLDSPPMLVTPP